MSGVDIYQFGQFANSGRALIARPMMPNDTPAFLRHIATILYEVWDLETQLLVTNGTLIPSDVMFDTAQNWSKDSLGYTFLWPAPGSIWPYANKNYRIVLVFIITDPCTDFPIIAGKGFKVVWQANTIDPTGQT